MFEKKAAHPLLPPRVAYWGTRSVFSMSGNFDVAVVGLLTCAILVLLLVPGDLGTGPSLLVKLSPFPSSPLYLLVYHLVCAAHAQCITN